MVTTIREVVFIDDYKKRKEVEWKSSVSLLKEPLPLIIIKLSVALVFLIAAAVFFFSNSASSDLRTVFNIVAVACLVVFVYISSATITDILKARRISKIYYKRVNALLEKELRDFDHTNGIEVELTISEENTHLLCTQEGSVLKDVRARTEEIQVNEFDSFITIDFNKNDTYTFTTNINAGDLANIREIFRNVANSYTSIEKGKFGKFHLESIKLKKD